MIGRNPVRGMRAFIIIWIGEVISILGTGLSKFVAGIWIYQRTGSVTRFSLIYLSFIIPSILLMPVAGTLVDRWDRRRTMILSNLGSSLTMLTIALLLFAGRLEFWHLYLAASVSAIFGVFNRLALNPVTALLVPKQDFARASGMMHVGPAATDILAPLLGAILLGIVHIQGVIMIDSVTFLVALGALLMVSIPRPEATTEDKPEKALLLQDTAYGWRYITSRAGLLGLLVFFAAINFTVAVSTALFTPLLLSLASVKTVGIVGSISSTGMLIGGVAIAIWGGPKRRVYGALSFGLPLGLGFMLIGLHPSVLLIAAVGFVIHLFGPLAWSSSQAIWLSKTAPEVQGRVFGVRMMIESSVTPLGLLIAGPLTEKVFEPLLAAGGLLAGSIGRLMSGGPRPGILLMFFIMGLLAVLTTAVGYLSSSLRLVEEELPDLVASQAGDEEMAVSVIADETMARA